MIIGIPSESKPHARVAGTALTGIMSHRLEATGGRA
jgi:hypothetical protein